MGWHSFSAISCTIRALPIPTAARRRRFSTTHPKFLTGDLPTPIKYYNPEIRNAYKQVEAISCRKLLALLPEELRLSYEPLLMESDLDAALLVKAADKLSAHIKCLEELKAGNAEFEAAAKQTRLCARADAAAVSGLFYGAFSG